MTKRKFKRYALLGEIRIRPLNRRKWIKAVLTNISRGGIGIYLNYMLRKNQKVSVKISYLRNGKLTAVEDISGTVRWVVPIGTFKAVGIKFDNDANKAEDPLLMRCIAYKKKTKK